MAVDSILEKHETFIMNELTMGVVKTMNVL